MSTTVTSPVQAAAQNVSTAQTRDSFPAKGGTFGGPFRVNREACLALPGESQVRLTESDVVVDGRFDPPGSGLYAFLATIGSGIFVVAMLQAFNFAAAPGWLVWYLIIKAVRRKPVSLLLSDATDVVVDSAASRIAFQTEFQEKPRWFAVELSAGSDRVVSQMRRLFGERVKDAAVSNASATPALILTGLILAAVAVAVFFALNPVG